MRSYPARRGGGMADAAVSKTAGGNPVRVRLPPPAPLVHMGLPAKRSERLEVRVARNVAKGR